MRLDDDGDRHLAVGGRPEARLDHGRTTGVGPVTVRDSDVGHLHTTGSPGSPT
ncbi:hypothetical protein ACL02R_17785 [Streptomyces sp. MS19]|uniref:hypothetical protein n=1 Tax=Streptomyces sp. MS19 TaxID=3385972 RepID=UPI00399FD2C5